MATTNNVSNLIENFRTQLARDAETQLRNVFPDRIQSIIELLKSPLFDLEANRERLAEGAQLEVPNFHEEKVTQVHIEVPTNPTIAEAYKAVKPLLLQLGEDAQLLRMWVMMNIPKIEDGNNFGVSVQEEVMADASRTESDVTSMLDFYCDYLVYRGKLNTKRLKWPGIKAYEHAIIDLDETTYIRIRMALQDIRNNYARLYDIFLKNISRIRNPRSDHNGMNAVDIMY